MVRNWHAILFPAILFPVGHDTGRTNVRWDFKLYVKITVTVVVDRVGARSAMKICEAIVADEIREAIRCDETPRSNPSPKVRSKSRQESKVYLRR